MGWGWGPTAKQKMFISKLHLNRRTFLRGMGATIALPLLDAMIPAGTAQAATVARPVPRMAFVYLPHGAIMSEWGPPARQRSWMPLGRILDPLTPYFRNDLTVVSGLENRNAYGPVHALTPGTWLSGASPRACGHPSHGITADQVAARHLGRDTLLPSLEMAVEEPRTIPAGAWEGEFSESYGQTISFSGPSVPRPMEFRLRPLFERLFAPGAVRAHRISRIRSRVSVLDLVADDIAGLERRLGAADRSALRNYLDTIRYIESCVDKVDAQVGRPYRFDERAHLLFEMIALAFVADITRVVSVMLAAETSQMTYPEIGIHDSFHALSHHQQDRDRIEKLIEIQSHYTRVLGTFLHKLRAAQDGGGSILDQSFILYGSNMSDSNAHDHFPLPIALIGGGCGTLRGDRRLRYPDRTPLSNLLVTLLHRAGVPVNSLGDSTGECSEL